MLKIRELTQHNGDKTIKLVLSYDKRSKRFIVDLSLTHHNESISDTITVRSESRFAKRAYKLARKQLKRYSSTF